MNKRDYIGVDRMIILKGTLKKHVKVWIGFILLRREKCRFIVKERYSNPITGLDRP
jgi:hypothetical protein